MNTKKTFTTETVNSAYKKDHDKINDRIKTESKRIMESKTFLNKILTNGKNTGSPYKTT